MQSLPELRKGTAQDAAQVSALLAQTWTQTYGDLLSPIQLAQIIQTFHSVENLKHQIENKNACFLVCEKNSEILGHAYASMKSADVVWLTKLYILPSAQGMGLGQLLLDEVCKRLAAAKVMQLEVGRENLGAIAFYKRNGFEKIGKVEKCGNKIDIAAFVMEMVLDNREKLQ